MENFKLTEEFLSNACDRFYVDSNDKNTLLKQFAKNKITEENIICHILNTSNYPNDLFNTKKGRKIINNSSYLRGNIKQGDYNNLIFFIVNNITKNQIINSEGVVERALEVGNNFIAIWLLSKGFKLEGDNHIYSIEAIDISKSVGCDFTIDGITSILYTWNSGSKINRIKKILELHPEFVKYMNMDLILDDEDTAIYIIENFLLEDFPIESLCEKLYYKAVDYFYKKGFNIDKDFIYKMCNIDNFEEIEKWSARFRIDFSHFIPYILKNNKEGFNDENLEILVKIYPSTVYIAKDLELNLDVKKWFLLNHGIFRDDMNEMIDYDINKIHDNLDRGSDIKTFIEDHVEIARQYLSVNPELEEYIKKYTDEKIIKELIDNEDFFMDKWEEISGELN